MSSGKYVSTPPRLKNQKIAANWIMTKKTAKSNWPNNGSAVINALGAKKSARTGGSL